MLDFASELVSFPTDATATYQSGRLLSVPELVIVAYDSSVRCLTMLEHSTGDSFS
jgi:hypothetical protein